MGKQIGIRLNADELQALRQVPGETDSARVRTLIHNQGIASGLALGIASAVTAAVSEKLDLAEAHLGMKISDVHPAPIIRKLAEQLNPILSELLTNTRKIR